MVSSSVNEVSTSGRTNESDNEGELGLEQFLGFLGQLVSYPPSSDALRELYKANVTIGGRLGNCIEFAVDSKNAVIAGVKSKVEKTKSLLVGLGLSRKKRVDSRSNKAQKDQSSMSMAGVDEGKRQVSGEEAQTNFSRTPGDGSSAQPNPFKPSKITLKYLKKWMLKALPASGTTGSGEVAKDKRGRVKPSGESGEKVAEGRSAMVDDLKEVGERAKLAVLHGEEDASKMVARLIKGIWLGIEEEKCKLKKTNIKVEKELAQSRTDALKEVMQLKASHAVVIGQLYVDTKANLDKMVEECD
ncbi:hypothetical protein GIB67_018902 [Kingdonia uniflora]|uniref:Uncharacterized protein n=1 Tax=Kingdonia uniflora TaxID=39325 RepID=A0A7J7NQR4_9MAGN|nr:hypothetical protein GIB67_018902 [Kingdonia uniflora]